MKDTQYSPSTTKIGAKYGLYTGLAFLLFLSLVYPLKLSEDPIISILSLVISVAGIYYAFREYKAYNEGYISFSQGFGIGMLVSTISGLISGVFYLVYLKMINLAEKDKMKQVFLDAFEKQNMKDEELEMAEKMLEYIPEMMFLGSVFGSLILGLVLSLALGSIFNKPRPPFE
jgi:hypothetical protein